MFIFFYWMVLMDAYSCLLLCIIEDGYYCIVILSVCHVQLLLMNIFRLLQSPLELASFSLHRHLFDWFFAKCSSWRFEVSMTLVLNNAKDCCRCKKVEIAQKSAKKGVIWGMPQRTSVFFSMGSSLKSPCYITQPRCCELLFGVLTTPCH